MTTHPKREYSRASIDKTIDFLRLREDSALLLAADMLESLASQLAAQKREGWKDPAGFSVDMILDEANNWTRRETGKQMLLNYAAFMADQDREVSP